MRFGRVAAVTASIALVGAIIGGVIGGALLTVWSFIAPGSTNESLEIAVIGTAAGAAIGAVLAPVTAWAFLRRVPLGRAIAHTTVGATLGAAAGLVLGVFAMPRFSMPPGGLVLGGTLMGFLAAAIRLRSKTRPVAVGTGIDGGAK